MSTVKRITKDSLIQTPKITVPKNKNINGSMNNMPFTTIAPIGNTLFLYSKALDAKRTPNVLNSNGKNTGNP